MYQPRRGRAILDCALAQLSRFGQIATGRRGDGFANQDMAAEDEAVIYFISRQLGDLFARYMPGSSANSSAETTLRSKQ
jgi:hypothetical protein